MKKITIIGMALLMAVLFSRAAGAHCEIPCGIYGDDMRFDMMEEHIQTLEKSIGMINELTAEGEKNYNQIVRWTMNKEHHADAMREILTQYFLAQRIKPPAPDDEDAGSKYMDQLSMVHLLIINLMKTKQNTDLEYTEKLKELLHDFEHSYMLKD